MDGRQVVADREWLGVEWFGWAAFQNASFSLSLCVVAEFGLVCLFCFVSHIRRKEAGPGWD